MREADQVPGHGAGAALGGHLGGAGGARNVTNTNFRAAGKCTILHFRESSHQGLPGEAVWLSEEGHRRH